jgi:mono/diheme cytochrome c family protein
MPRSSRFPIWCCVWLAVSTLSRAAEVEPAAQVKDVLAFAAKHCVACHSGSQPKADLSLANYKDLAGIAAGRDDWESVVAMVEAGEMPPQDKPQPTTDETAAFLKNVQVLFDYADRTSKPDPGRVTIRRLNRAEYNNTVRDLVGVDFAPAEDFPSDDVGHGFDNIGDVLTLPPVLMERYLAAAGSIMDRAISVNPPKPPVRSMHGKYLEPSGAWNQSYQFRPISPKPDDKPINTGPLHTPYPNLPEGEYSFRFRAYATTEGQAPVKVAVMLVGKELTDVSLPEELEKIPFAKNFPGAKILQILEIAPRVPKAAQNYDVPFTLPAGMQRVSVGIVAPPKGEPLPTLYVEYFALTGPKDTRPPSHRKLLACSPDKPQAEQTREVLSRFATRAYRRPATDDEVARLVKLVEAAQAEGTGWESAVQFAMEAVLCSPKFLFRVELDDRPDSPGMHPIGEFQLASRLSYFLWATMPDQELFDLAAKGELSKNLEPQVRRMLADPKARALFDQFALQWLQLGRLRQAAPDKELFPTFTEELRGDMLRETELFFNSVVQEDRPITDLVAADYSFLNQRLAEHYQIADTAGNPRGLPKGQKPPYPAGQSIPRDQFVRVSLPDGKRGGLLTMAGVLTVTSNPTRTSPVKRGRFVLEQILGTPPPPPPPNVPELAAGKEAELTGTLRQRMEQHRANPACANCHAKMDPLGFALENYNAIGRFRDKDGEFAIDASGTLPGGQSFQGPAELKQIMLGKRELLARALAEKMLTYALGRGLESYDRPTLKKITAALAADDYKFSRLAIEIVQSDPFRMQRGKETSP